VVGELGKSAEKVAKRAVGRLRKFLNSSANVEEYLADQLLLPMLLANNGSFTTTQPSLHTLTNIMVIEQFGVKGFTVEQTNNTLWQIAKASDS
jgi:RNA 3'-terminal phosphate cyclase (ATP)